MTAPSKPREWLKDMTLEMAEKVFQELRADTEKLAEALAIIASMQSEGFNNSGLQWHQVEANKALAEFRKRWPKGQGE
jgi:NAD-specific glutamate dehydrogenase